MTEGELAWFFVGLAVGINVATFVFLKAVKDAYNARP